MSASLTYDPHKVVATFAGIELKGFSDESLIATEDVLLEAKPRVSGSCNISFQCVIRGGDTLEALHARMADPGQDRRYWPVTLTERDGTSYPVRIDMHKIKTVKTEHSTIWFFGHEILRLQRKERRRKRMALRKKRGWR